MAYKSAGYTPNKRGREILDRAWQHVSGVPYKVTTRWLFYQLYQDGFYHSKNDYKNGFVPLLSRARHNGFGLWRPDSLVDDRRDAIKHEGGYRDPGEWAREMASSGWTCNLDHFYNQENYIEVWFEAEAMSRQFQHYTRGITLRPFSGMPSIGYKYSIAQDLRNLSRCYGKPIVILYFGDYDLAGLTIPETSVNDIRCWCSVSFEFIRCGLNDGDGERFGIPENFEKPGVYQWEALNDDLARGLITSSIERFIDDGLRQQAVIDGKRAALLFDDYVSGFENYYRMNI
jgi:hypothetical protein